MGKYKFVGRALTPGDVVPAGLNIGDEVNLDLSNDQEQQLVSQGVLEPVEDAPKAAPPKTEAPKSGGKAKG